MSVKICDLPTENKELKEKIEQLKKLVKFAYEEGWNERGTDEGGYNEGIFNTDWELSKAKKTLKEEKR